LVDLVLSCILVPASTVLAVVCACGPYGKHVQASEVVFLSVCLLVMVCCPVLVLTSALVILSFHERPSILLCHLWCACIYRLFVNVVNEWPHISIYYAEFQLNMNRKHVVIWSVHSRSASINYTILSTTRESTMDRLHLSRERSTLKQATL